MYCSCCRRSENIWKNDPQRKVCCEFPDSVPETTANVKFEDKCVRYQEAKKGQSEMMIFVATSKLE